MITLPNVRTDTDYFAFEGGLDLVTPALSMPAGAVISSQNYEPDVDGGYSRRKGYERFDGRTAPSTAVSTATGTVTSAIEAQSIVDNADVLRALITVPSGSGPIRGVCYFGGAAYCFRDNGGGTAGQMFKSSASGWQLQPLGEEVAFSNANTSVGAGDVLTQGAVTANIMRVVVQTGTLASGTNTGFLVIASRAGGNYAAGAATSTGAGAVTLGGAQAALTLPAGGRYNTAVYNFYGQAITSRLYGCNGVGRAFEWDGTTFAYLRTGAATDTPAYIKPNRKFLFLAQGSSVMHSAVGDPYRWTAVDLAGEIAVGDTITGLSSLPGEALAIVCRNSSFALTGSGPTTFNLTTIRDDVGAVPYTLQTMSDTYMLDDRGVVALSAVQEYGNFADATLSKKIQKLVDRIRSKVVGAYVIRQKGHYVLMMNDGATLTMGVSNKQPKGFLEGALPFTPSCMWSGEDDTGVERIFVGATNGFVYEMDKGSTFDGAAIESILKIFYLNSRSPRIRKRYRKLIVQMTSVLHSEINFAAEYSYGATEIEQTRRDTLTQSGPGASWGTGIWDEFYWGGADVSQPEVSLDGTGLNIAMLFASNTRLDFGHTLQGALIHYTPRRLQR